MINLFVHAGSYMKLPVIKLTCVHAACYFVCTKLMEACALLKWKAGFVGYTNALGSYITNMTKDQLISVLRILHLYFISSVFGRSSRCVCQLRTCVLIIFSISWPGKYNEPGPTSFRPLEIYHLLNLVSVTKHWDI